MLDFDGNKPNRDDDPYDRFASVRNGRETAEFGHPTCSAVGVAIIVCCCCEAVSALWRRRR
eukprot:7316317-Prymnesium_polylepis.1